MYVLIEVIDRDISSPSYFHTHKAAHDEMCERLSQVMGCPLESIIEAYVGDGEYDNETHIGEDIAYTSNGGIYDWAIFQTDSANEPEVGCVKIPIEMVRPPVDVTIAVRPDMYVHDLEFIRTMFENIKSSFPNNPVVVIPTEAELVLMDIEELEAVRSQINEIIRQREDVWF